jgi:hypothetical protein
MDMKQVEYGFEKKPVYLCPPYPSTRCTLRLYPARTPRYLLAIHYIPAIVNDFSLHFPTSTFLMFSRLIFRTDND